MQRYPFQLEWVVNQAFEIDHDQLLLFAIRSFDHLYEQVRILGDWLDAGRLDQVAGDRCPTPVAA